MTKNEVAMITCKMACDDCRRNHIFVDCIKDECATYLNKQALEKQIPKKPTYKEFKIILATVGEKTDGDFLCSCGSAVYSDYKFCPECGQALDWKL